MQLRDLYQSMIVDNALHPQHQQALKGSGIKKVYGFNSSCGDQLLLAGRFQEQRLQEVSFHAQGCIISRASANIMGNLCLRQRSSKIITLITDFSKLVVGKSFKDSYELGEAWSLRSVSKLPTRIKCAMLPWETMYRLVKNGVN